MNDEVQPDLVVNLGDDIEDESREADLARYGECQAILRDGAGAARERGGQPRPHPPEPRRPVAASGSARGPLYYSFDHGGWHFVVLHTIEKQDVEIRVPETQLEWLRADLAATDAPDGRAHAPLGERAGRSTTRAGGRGARTWRS